MPPSRHAKVSPSKLEGYEACSCYDREPFEEKDDQEETPSERGTRLHEAVEKEDLTLCLNDDEKELVQLCIDSSRLLAMSAGEGAEVLREVQVEIHDPEDPEDLITYGTADWVLKYPGGKRFRGRDYKFIRTPSVSAPQENVQIQTYAVGLFEKFPEAEVVEFDLIMPEFRHLPDPVVLTRADVPRLIARIKDIKRRREDPFKVPTPCDMCPTCLHAGRCPALGKMAVSAGRALGLPLPESFAPDAPRTPHERALAMIVSQMLTQWAEQIKAHMNDYGRSDPNAVLPGYSWMSRKGNPKILSTAKVRPMVQLTDPDFLECCKLSITSLAKKYASVHGCSEKAARESLNTLLKEHIVRGADVTFWQRAKDGASVAEIVAGVSKGLPGPVINIDPGTETREVH